MKYLSVTVLRFFMFVAYTTFERRFGFEYHLRLSNFFVTAFNNEDSKFLGNNFYKYDLAYMR